MNDLVEGCKITGEIRLDGEDIYDSDMDVNAAAPAAWAWCSRSPIRSR